jgi:tetratricopeptide (TPR) repeat protein
VLPAQSSPASPPDPQEIETLLAAQHWDDVVRILSAQRSRTPEADYEYGVALAHSNRLTEAQTTLEAGSRLAPLDPRFPVELAGIAFQQKRYPLAAKHLRRALRLAPGDAYTNDFLGTVYFLEGNVPAALKYWNRVHKPEIAEVREDPEPRVAPALLDRAFAFSPAATLLMRQYLDSETRIGGLGIFPQHQLDLRARGDGRFDLVFRGQERNGFGDSKLEALFLLLRELPFQGVTPEYYNLHREAINLTSLFRWDAQKRRIFAEYSGPFERSARYRYALATDLRNENWAIRNSFRGTAPTLASLNLRTERAAFGIASLASDRLRWSVGAEFSHRDYRSVVPGAVLTPPMLASGYQLKQQAQVEGTILRIPEHRFTLSAGASSNAARLWSQPAQTFEKLQGVIGWHWLPQAQGDNYETQQQVRAGRTFGQVPFDELFMLGLERDNNLPMRAHIGTRDGVKGSAPLGRDYFLTSWEGDKNLYSNGLITVKLGPLLDIGSIADPSTALGSHRWLFDTGAQVKLRVFSTTVAFSWGHDLRTGNNAFYVMLPK